MLSYMSRSLFFKMNYYRFHKMRPVLFQLMLSNTGDI